MLTFYCSNEHTSKSKDEEKIAIVFNNLVCNQGGSTSSLFSVNKNCLNIVFVNSNDIY